VRTRSSPTAPLAIVTVSEGVLSHLAANIILRMPDSDSRGSGRQPGMFCIKFATALRRYSKSRCGSPVGAIGLPMRTWIWKAAPAHRR